MTKLEQQFWAFAQAQRIPSKDEGVIPFRPWRTQQYVVGQIFDGIDRGIHDFWTLKARQLGISVVLWLLDAFWVMKFGGTQGLLICDGDSNMAVCRDTFTELVKSIPKEWKPKGGIGVSNRDFIRFGNGSRLMYSVAGVREKNKSQLGRSRGVSFLHGTETAFWGGESGLQALEGALSERNPHRLFNQESTANGFNFYYDRWHDARRAVTKRAIFAGWWLHPHYTTTPGSAIYTVYMRDGRPDPDERAWGKEVKREYGHEITLSQWAWYRWKRAEKLGDDELMMHQEFPTLPEHAFQATGSGYLGAVSMQRLRERLKLAPQAKHYRFEWAGTIEGSQLVEVGAPQAQLTIWEEPEDRSTGCRYVVAADPAFGAHGSSDNGVVSVWKTTRTKMIQVAEYASNENSLKQFAWVCAYLCGQYQVPHLIVELMGPGWGVLEELNWLRDYGHGTARHPELQNVLGAIQHYVYRRPDSMGSGAVWHWQTTGQTKPRIMGRLRDAVVNTALEIRSPGLVTELAGVRQDGDEYFTEGRAKDDRVLSAALAVEMWLAQVVPLFQFIPDSQDVKDGILSAPDAPHGGQRAVTRLFDRILQ